MASNREKERKEKERLYGELIVDFVNAKTAEDVYRNFFENLQRAFDFGLQFPKKAAGSLSAPLSKKNERTLCNLLRMERPIMEPLGAHLIKHCLKIKGYDRTNKALMVIEADLNEPDGDEGAYYWVYGKTFELPLNKEPAHSIRWAKKLTRVADRILDLKNILPIERFSQLESIANVTSVRGFPIRFKRMPPSLYEYVEKNQISLKNVLEAVLNGGTLNGCQEFMNFFSHHQRPQYHLDENGFIVEKRVFDESHFYHKELFPENDPYLEVLSYCLIEFLKTPYNRKLIRKCGDCRDYFIASKDDKRIKKCPTCSPKSSMSREQRNEYMRDRRRKEKEEKASQQREATIANYMKNLPCTREEAVEIIEADLMM